MNPAVFIPPVGLFRTSLAKAGNNALGLLLHRNLSRKAFLFEIPAGKAVTRRGPCHPGIVHTASKNRPASVTPTGTIPVFTANDLIIQIQRIVIQNLLEFHWLFTLCTARCLMFSGIPIEFDFRQPRTQLYRNV